MWGMERLSRREAVTLLELIEAARRCTDMEGFQGLIGALGSLVSFDMAICGLAQLDSGGNLKDQQIVNISYPEEWLSIYAERGFIAVDPVVRAHMTDFSARAWSDAYRQWGRPRHFLSLAEDFGIRNGYSFGALSPTDSSASIFSFCIDKKNPPHITEILDILAPHFHEALRRTVQAGSSSPIATLTQREIEVVRWMANGKNSWEISVILGISERTVKFHTSAILQKLGASNRTHAVAKAISLGLIQFG
jgi:DNA-binding CsgD family transcriptional regulator